MSKIWNAPGGPFELAADYYYNNGFFYEASNLERSHQHAYDLLDFRASYLYATTNVRITTFVKNVFNTNYTTGAVPDDFGQLVNFAPPRTYGARVGWEF